MNFVLLDIAIYTYLIVGFFSLGRVLGFPFRQNNRNKGNYWIGITVYCFLVICALIATMALLNGIEPPHTKSTLEAIFNPVTIMIIAWVIGFFSVPTKNDLVIKKCRENLKRGRAIATGIGVFARIRRKSDGAVLLRRRTEKGSLFGQDLSGKFELIGGGTEVSDFEKDYQSAAKKTLKREMKEEARLRLDVDALTDLVFRIAWLAKDNTFDLAFVADVPEEATMKICRHQDLLDSGELVWVPVHELDGIKFVSERMKHLATQGIL